MAATVGNTTFTSTVTCNGLATAVSTTQMAGETIEAAWARHLQDVADKRAECSGTPLVSFAEAKTPYRCDGTPKSVDTNQNPGEDNAAFLERHKAAIQAAIEAC